MKGARTLIIGLDGATWAVADTLIDQGLVPNLAYLKKRGSWGWLNSTNPPMTLPSWSSMLTGCNPGQHGIFDFVRYENQRLRFVTAQDRKVPTIHQIISKRGGRVASLLVPTTWPPVSINGVMISGFDSPVSTDIDGSFCHPKSLFHELRKRFGSLHFADLQESNIQEGWHQEALPKLLREVYRKRDMGLWLLEQERWDCFMLLFGESDTVAHHFWMFHDPHSPRFRNVPALRTAIQKVYQRLDEALGALLDKSNADWICVCSDHGFGGAGEHVLYLNRFLEEHGWLKHKRESSLASLRTMMGMYVPHAILGQIFRHAPQILRDRLEGRARYGGISFPHTRAFSDEMNYAATIRMPSRVGVARLKEQLLAWSVDGHHPIQEVYEREELYTGSEVKWSPELVLELNQREGYSYTLLNSAHVPKGVLWNKLQPKDHFGGKGLGMNGTHRQHGILALYGRGIQQKEIQADMQDIVPTLLYLMGEDVPLYMDGRVCVEAGDISYCEDTIDREPQEFQPLTNVQSQKIQTRLEHLGYL